MTSSDGVWHAYTASHLADKVEAFYPRVSEIAGVIAWIGAVSQVIAGVLVYFGVMISVALGVMLLFGGYSISVVEVTTIVVLFAGSGSFCFLALTCRTLSELLPALAASLVNQGISPTGRQVIDGGG